MKGPGLAATESLGKVADVYIIYIYIQCLILQMEALDFELLSYASMFTRPRDP